MSLNECPTNTEIFSKRRKICLSLHVGLELTWTLWRVSMFFYNVAISPLFRWVSCCCPAFWCDTDRGDIQVSVLYTITEGRLSCCERNIDMRLHPQQRESGKIDSKTKTTSTQGIATHIPNPCPQLSYSGSHLCATPEIKVFRSSGQWRDRSKDRSMDRKVNGYIGQ